MERPTFRPEDHPRRVNLGCGFDRRAGYLNVDLHAWHNPDLVADVTDLAVLPDGFYEHVLAQDVLEHIPRLRTRSTLKEWNRILCIGGTLELRVPDLMGALGLLARPENQAPARQEQLIQFVFGTQCYTGDFHYIGFTRPFLAALLKETGFHAERLDTMDGWLFVVRARKVEHVSVDALLRIENPEAFLESAFRELLGREPDSDGIAFYRTQLMGGTIREAVLESIRGSEEYRARQASGNG